MVENGHVKIILQGSFHFQEIVCWKEDGSLRSYWKRQKGQPLTLRIPHDSQVKVFFFSPTRHNNLTEYQSQTRYFEIMVKENKEDHFVILT